MTGLSTIPALNRIANRACTDILDQRLPGLFKTRLECAGEEWRDPLAAQLADIDAQIPRILPYLIGKGAAVATE